MAMKDLHLSEIMDAVSTGKQDSVVSLFKYARQSIISSRTYISAKLENEEILSPLMMNIMNLYVGLILTALGMDRAVTKTKTVRDQIRLVGTENFHTDVPVTTLKAALDDFFGSSPRMASYGTSTENKTVDEESEVDIQSSSSERSSVDDRYDVISGKVVDTQGKEIALPCGRLIQIDLDTGKLVSGSWSESGSIERSNSRNNALKESRSESRDDHIEETITTYDLDPYSGVVELDSRKDQIKIHDVNNTYTNSSDTSDKYSRSTKRAVDQKSAASEKVGAKVTLNLLLQLTPVFITPDVAEQFVRLNFRPNALQRLRMVHAGEISFFKDFIFGLDIARKRLKALVQDKTGALKDMLDKQQNAINKHFNKTIVNASGLGRDTRANIANTILIFDKFTFDRACSASGFKFNTPEQRQRFFDASYAMMLCVVDPMYGRVDMYYNGLDAYSTWKYDQVKRNAKNESMDLSAIMKNYAANMAPKF